MRKIHSIDSQIFAALLLILFGVFESNAQNNNDILHPAPSVSELISHKLSAPNYFLGLPSFNVPIHTIKIKGYQLPIDLSYHYEGFKPAQVATPVGLGWSLNFGGIIARSVRGKPDEDPSLGYHSRMKALGVSSYRDLVTWYSNSSDDQKRAIIHGTWDMVPDEYYLTIPGESLRFLEFREGQFTTIPYRPIEIKRPSWNKFEVRDASGTLYLFGNVGDDSEGVDYTTAEYSSGEVEGYSSAWVLRKIVSVSGQEIIFNYERVSLPDPVSHTEEYHRIRQGAGSNAACEELIGYQGSSTAVSHASSRVISIESPYETVEFKYDTPRSDNVFTGEIGRKSLDRILVKKKNGELLKKYNLNHDNGARLLFTSIVEERESESLELYSFAYHDDSDFPSYDTRAIDHWEFYRGGSNTSLIPDYVSNSNFNHLFNGGNRDPNFNGSILGALHSVTLPTKGKIEYEYEGRDCGATKSGYMGYNRFNRNVVALANLTDQGTVTTKTFSIDESTPVDIRFDLSSEYPVAVDPIYVRLSKCSEDADCSEEIFYRYAGTNTVSGEERISLAAGDYELKAETFNAGENAHISIRYEEIDRENPITQSNIGGIRLKRIKEIDADGQTLSVKKFGYRKTDDPNKSSGVTGKWPEYDFFLRKQVPEPGSSLIPIGIECTIVARRGNSNFRLSLGSSVVGYEEVQVYEGENGEYGQTNYYFSSNQDVIFPVIAPAISYDYRRGKMTKYEQLNESGDVLLKKEFRYRSHPAEGEDILSNEIGGIFHLGYQIDAIQPQFDKFNNPYFGQLKTEWYYLNQEKETAYTYDDGELVSTLETTTDYKYNNIEHAQVSNTCLSLSHQGKKYCSHTLFPKDYDEGSSFLSETNSKHLLNVPVEHIEYVKNGEDNEVVSGSVNFYIPDQAGRISKVLKAETETPISVEDFEMSNGLTAKQVLEGASIPEAFNGTLDGSYHNSPTVEFITYDDIGNVLEVHHRGGQVNTYVWGYHQKYPIARLIGVSLLEINNADSDLIEDLSGLSDADNDRCLGVTGCAESALRSELMGLYDLFPDAMITTYTYDPLIGMTSQTDVNGRCTYYEYDDLGRLKYLLNPDRDIIRETSYSYRD